MVPASGAAALCPASPLLALASSAAVSSASFPSSSDTAASIRLYRVMMEGDQGAWVGGRNCFEFIFL